MKKSELKVFTDYFGQLPLSKVKDQETRLAIVKLYCELSKLLKPVTDEIEILRNTIVGDKQNDVNQYVLLREKGDEESMKKADEMVDCIQIEKDFREATRRVYEEVLPDDVKIPKVQLGVLYEALMDCGFPKLRQDAGLSTIVAEFPYFVE